MIEDLTHLTLGILDWLDRLRPLRPVDGFPLRRFSISPQNTSTFQRRPCHTGA